MISQYKFFSPFFWRFFFFSQPKKMCAISHERVDTLAAIVVNIIEESRNFVSFVKKRCDLRVFSFARDVEQNVEYNLYKSYKCCKRIEFSPRISWRCGSLLFCALPWHFFPPRDDYRCRLLLHGHKVMHAVTRQEPGRVATKYMWPLEIPRKNFQYRKSSDHFVDEFRMENSPGDNSINARIYKTHPVINFFFNCVTKWVDLLFATAYGSYWQ